MQRSTLSDASKRRPMAVFAETFALLAAQLDRRTRREGQALVRLIDSTPIPFGTLCRFATWNGRIRGMKLHLVYDPKADRPRVLDITDATVNDALVGRTVPLETGATYVFDKGYCHYGWWTAIAGVGSHFVTRPRTTMKLSVLRQRIIADPGGDGFTVLEDADVALSSKGDSKLPIALRRLQVLRHQDRKTLTLITSDGERPAAATAALYKGRWQIELLFRWIKQNLRTRTFLGRTPNAIRLQIFAAMVAFALLRIAARTHRVTLPILRFTGLVATGLFKRRPIEAIHKPPPVHPSRKADKTSQHQIAFHAW